VIDDLIDTLRTPSLRRRQVLLLASSSIAVGLLSACGGAPGPAAVVTASVGSASAVSAATVALPSVVSTSSAAATPVPQAAGGAKAPATIQWATRTIQQWTKIWPQAVTMYQQLAPGVTVQLVESKDANLQDYLVAWAGGSGPDIAAMWGTNLVTAGRSGQLLIHDAYIKRDKFPLDDYIPYQLKAMQWQGKQFALPMYINVYPIYYNKTVFQKKGIPFPDKNLTWQSYQDMLVKLTDPSGNLYGGAAFGEPYARPYESGGGLENPTDPTKVGWASDQSLQAWQWIHDRVWKDKTVILSGTPEYKALGVASFNEAFTAGKVATMEQGSYLPATLAAQFPNAVQDWDLAFSVNGPVQRAVGGSIDAWAVWSQSKALDANWEFGKFLQSQGYLDLQCQIGALQHPRSSMQDRYIQVMQQSFPALVGKNLEAFADCVRNKYARPNGGIFAKDQECWALFNTAYANAITKNQGDLKTIFTDAARQAEAVLAQA
jgi:multiple sugar transport system substrate-binding protein